MKMSRNYGAPFDFLESEPVGRTVDCLGPRQAAGPFHYLINEQAKSLLALQELQHEVGALLEFRDLVIETFPSLRTKLSTSSSSSSTTNAPISHGGTGVGPALARTTDWVPGVRVRRKLGAKKNDAVPDSGFSTETSSKDTHSASSTAMANTSAGTADDTDDELWSLLDVIHRRGTRLKDEVEALQGQLQQQQQQQSPPEDDFHRIVFRASEEDVQQIRRERDSLMGRLAEKEAEVVSSRIHTTRLQEDLENLLATKKDLEEQLRAVLDQRGEVNSRIHDMHSQFVTKSASTLSSATDNKDAVRTLEEDNDRAEVRTNLTKSAAKKPAPSQRVVRTSSADCECDSGGALDRALGGKIPKVQVTDSKKFSAILSERNPLVLQKHLLSSTVQNEILLGQLESASRLEVNLVDKLDKVREENEELRFQLEDKNIELEGTRARVRMLEQQQRVPPTHVVGPDVIPISTLSSSSPPPSRSEILSTSMKNMSPLPMMAMIQLDHSSSTESAHDQTETNRKHLENGSQQHRRKPSKIPLKSYSAPKPPGRGKSHTTSTHGSRSRSGDSHTAHSIRNGNAASPGKNDSPAGGGSLHALTPSRGGGGGGGGNSLNKSRNGSLVTSKDSLSSKLRSSDSLSKLSPGNSNSFGNGAGSRAATLRKNSSPIVKWTSGGASGGGKEQQPAADKDDSARVNREKSQYRWSPCSFERQEEVADYPDSLDRNCSSSQQSTTTDSSSRRFQTANTFTWNNNNNSNNKPKEYYDSIDSNLFSSLYQQNGEQLAECDSLERHISVVSDQ